MVVLPAINGRGLRGKYGNLKFKEIFCLVLLVNLVLDMGKWSIGRYLDCNVLLSAVLVLVGSLILSIIIKWRSTKAERK